MHPQALAGSIMTAQTGAVKDNTNWALLAGMRFVLAWIVTCAHMDAYFFNVPGPVRSMMYVGAKAAVVGFFLVSGYSIAASVKRYPTGFYRRRLLRVYPIYLLAIASAFLLERMITGDLVLPRGEVFQASSLVTTLGNVFFLQTFLVKPISYDVPVWSLAVEMSYYLLAPLLVRVPRWGLIAVIAVSAVSYACPRSDENGTAYFLFTHFNMLTYAWAWFMGYYLFIHRSSLVVVGFAALGAVLIMTNTYLNPEPYAVQTYLVGFAVVVLAAHNTITIRDALAKRVLNFLGNISYPLYLLQYPIILGAYAFWGTQNTVALLTLCLLGSTAAYYLVDVYLKHGAVWLIGQAPVIFGKPAAAPHFAHANKPQTVSRSGSQ
jgi:peptidoglycan/LPS O-acetylase OafA/YrhL